MKKLVTLLFISLLAGCQSSPQPVTPYFASDIIEIDVENLSDYWVQDDHPIIMLRKRPDWLPEGHGEWTVLTVIDSNGIEVEKTLIDSSPEGFMTQERLDEIPKGDFAPASSNQQRVPVRFYSTAKIAPRSEL